MRITDWENSNSRADVIQFSQFKMDKDRQVVRAFGYVNIPTMGDVPDWHRAEWDDSGRCVRLSRCPARCDVSEFDIPLQDYGQG